MKKVLGKLSLLMTVFCLLSACQTRKNSEKEIVIDNSNISNYYPIDLLIDSIQVIKLETNPKSIVSNVPTKLLINGSYLYWIELGYEGRVTIFNKNNGKFIHQLIPTGEGPQEFSYITDVILTRAGNLELFTSSQRKFIYFSAEGDFLSEKKAIYNLERRIYVDKNLTLNHYNGPSADYVGQKKDYRLFLLDSTEHIKNYFLPFQFTNKTISGSVMNFSENEQGINIFEPFYSDIFELSKTGELKSKYQLHFETNNPDADFVIDNTSIAARLKVASVSNIPILNLFFENNKYAFVKYSHDKGVNSVAIFDKNLQKTIANTNALIYAKWAWPLMVPESACKENMVFSYSPESFITLYDKLLGPDQPIKALRAIRKSLKPTDNPILIIASLKK